MYKEGYYISKLGEIIRIEVWGDRNDMYSVSTNFSMLGYMTTGNFIEEFIEPVKMPKLLTILYGIE